MSTHPPGFWTESCFILREWNPELSALVKAADAAWGDFTMSAACGGRSGAQLRAADQLADATRRLLNYLQENDSTMPSLGEFLKRQI